MCRVQRVFQIDAGEDRKDIGLNEGHENFEPVHRGDRDDRQRRHGDADAREQDQRREGCEHFHDRVSGHHVARKTNGMADRAHEVGNHLDQRQDRAQRQRCRRHPEQPEEPGTVLDETDHGHRHENQQGQSPRHRDMRRGGKGARQQAKEVREHDEQEQREDIGEELEPVLARHILDHLVNETIGQFRDRLRAARDHGATTGADHHHEEDRSHTDREPKRHVGGRIPMHGAIPEERPDDELVHRVEHQLIADILRHISHVCHPLHQPPIAFQPARQHGLHSSLWRSATSPSRPPRTPAS